MAHGNIYAPEKVDAALANYFRPGNLTALRELALLWVADRVDEALQTYRSEHGIGGVWETRERVVVALTGGPEGDTLIRRAARIADRSAGGDLLAVHVARSDGLAAGCLARRRWPGSGALVEDLGGSYHSVVGDDVATALVEFARAENATQLVLGTSRRGRLERFLTGRGTGETVVAALRRHRRPHGHPRTGRARHAAAVPAAHPVHRPAGSRARWPAWCCRCCSPLVLDRHCAGRSTSPARRCCSWSPWSGVACIGGVVSALIASVTASLLLNYWFIPPIGEFTSTTRTTLLALVVFAVVAATVAAVVDRSLRLSRRAARATAEAETHVLAGRQHRARRQRRSRRCWNVPARPSAWTRRSCVDDAARTTDGRHGRARAGRERLPGAARPHPARPPSGASSPRSPRTWRSAVERARLAEAAAEVEPVKAADRMRTALLAAVSHDLRTPLAAGWAAVSSLRSRDVEFTDEDRDELLATADESMARLNRLVENLLDISRLQAGALTLNLRRHHAGRGPAGRAGSLTPAGPVEVADLDDGPGGAGRPAAAGAGHRQPRRQRRPAQPGRTRQVLLTASALADRVEVRVVDRGPGLPADGPGPALRTLPAAGRHRQHHRPRPRPRPRPGPDRGDGRHAHPRGHPRRRPDHGAVPAASPSGRSTPVIRRA